MRALKYLKVKEKHKVKEILKIKYNLIIKNTNHLKLDITKEINTIRMVAFLACENIFIV